eukprot:m.71979 g.71979  ORF g.71979 m.71979 type:complete len:272 (-) comp8365_c0_seq10:1628-2443(-)
MFCVYKPPNITSAQCVARIKNILRSGLGVKKLKVGHGGTLDKYAEGVLVIGVGKSCKLLQQYIDGDKEYKVQAQLGISTTSHDRDGAVLAIRNPALITKHMIQDILPRYSGRIMQTPPRYSALKRNGQRYSDLARAGKINDWDFPQPREVTVYALHQLIVGTEEYEAFICDTGNTNNNDENAIVTDVNGFHSDILQSFEHGTIPCKTMELHVACSKGFYIRSLIHAIGQDLECGAYVTRLQRVKANSFTLDSAIQEKDWNFHTFNQFLKAS